MKRPLNDALAQGLWCRFNTAGGGATMARIRQTTGIAASALRAARHTSDMLVCSAKTLCLADMGSIDNTV